MNSKVISQHAFSWCIFCGNLQLKPPWKNLPPPPVRATTANTIVLLLFLQMIVIIIKYYSASWASSWPFTFHDDILHHLVFHHLPTFQIHHSWRTFVTLGSFWTTFWREGVRTQGALLGWLGMISARKLKNWFKETTSWKTWWVFNVGKMYRFLYWDCFSQTFL